MSQPDQEPCDLVAERVALGESLAELGDHAATCPRCRAVVALPVALGEVAPGDAEPGLGFAARMTAGAQRRIVARRRRRIAGTTAAALAACAALAVGVPWWTSSTEVAIAPVVSPALDDRGDRQAMADPWRSAAPDDAPPARRHADSDVRELVGLADVHRDLRGTARWNRIARSLRPYRSLVEGVKP